MWILGIIYILVMCFVFGYCWVRSSDFNSNWNFIFSVVVVVWLIDKIFIFIWDVEGLVKDDVSL